MGRNKLLKMVSLSFALVLVLTACGTAYSGVDFDKYIKLANYKGIELTKQDEEVTEEEIEKAIQVKLEEKKTSTDVTTGVVKDGDNINIDYVGSIDGVKFSGGEEKGRELVIGSNKFIPGFESSLIGATVGTTENIKVKFPDDYGEKSLAGKNAVFAVKINSKKEYTVPELDETFVKENSKKAKSVDEYKELIKKEIGEKKALELAEIKRQEAFQKLIAESEINKNKKDEPIYPEKQLQSIIDGVNKTYEDRAKKENMSVKDFISKNFSMDEKAFKEEIKSYAKTQVKRDLIIYAIADKEGIKLKSDEYKDFIKKTLAKYGYTEETFEEANNGKSYENIVGKERIEAEALKEKVLDFVVSKAKFE